MKVDRINREENKDAAAEGEVASASAEGRGERHEASSTVPENPGIVGKHR